MTISTLMPAMYLTPSSKERGTWHECGKDYTRGQAFYTTPPAISRTATPDDSPYPATIAGGCWLAQAWADGYNARNALTVAPAAPQSDHLKRALKLAGEAKELADRIRAEELTLQAPVVPDDVAAALDWIDDFIARCNGNDRGACNSVNVLRHAMQAVTPTTG